MGSSESLGYDSTRILSLGRWVSEDRAGVPDGYISASVENQEATPRGLLASYLNLDSESWSWGPVKRRLLFPDDK